MKDLRLVPLLFVLIVSYVCVRAHEDAEGLPELVMGPEFERAARDFQAQCSRGISSCVLQNQASQGPYYVAQQYVRQNIKETQSGIPLTINLQFVDASTCEPVVGSAVDIWHANATGVYSHFEIPANEGGASTTFLRGTQVSDATGSLTFNSIFPGYYEGRPTHIHLKVRHPGSSAYIETGQMYFSEDLVTAVNKLAPYNTNNVYRVELVDDAIYFLQSTSIAIMQVTPVNPNDLTQGLIASLVLGVNPNYNGPDFNSESNPSFAEGGRPPCIAAENITLTNKWTDSSSSYNQYSLSFTNNGPCPVIGLQVTYDNPHVSVNQAWNLAASSWTLGSVTQPAFTVNDGYVVLNPGQTTTGSYGVIFAYNSAVTNGDPGFRLGHVNCGGFCAAPFQGASSVFCSTVTFTSSLVSSWNTGSQWSVVMKNTGSKSVTLDKFRTLQYSTVSSIWNVNNIGGGYFTLPNWVPTLAPGATLTFGYVVNQVSAISFTTTEMIC